MRREMTETELQAYVDCQLDLESRVAVQSYLEAHPEAAADVMEAMRQRDELRLWLQADDETRDARTVALTRRFGWVLTYRRVMPVAARAAAIVGLLALGSAGHALLRSGSVELAGDPENVLADDAARAWRVAQLDAPDVGGDGTMDEPAGVTPSARLPAHAWPVGIRPLGAETIEWQGGTAVVELATTAGGDELVLLQAQVDVEDAQTPDAETVNGVTTVAWRDQGVAYALSSGLSQTRLLTIAHFIDGRT